MVRHDNPDRAGAGAAWQQRLHQRSLIRPSPRVSDLAVFTPATMISDPRRPATGRW
jgi:hypothetical protein